MNKSKRIPAGLHQAFADLCAGWAAVYVAGPEGPLYDWRPKGINYAVWPVRVGITTTLSDNVTSHAKSWSPVWWQGVLFRLWCRTREEALWVKGFTHGFIKENEPYIRSGWADLGPDTDIEIMEFQLKCLIEDRGIEVMDENELRAWLTSGG